MTRPRIRGAPTPVPTRFPNADLRDRVRAEATDRPGVYHMVGPGGEVLYVGKSVRVRSRLLSYFRAPPSEKAGELIRSTRSIDWEYLPDEFSALVREMKLIQSWRPRFNVQHKRKKRYGFIKVTAEMAPRILPVRQVVADGSTYFGPFSAMGRVGEVIRALNQVFRLRDCPGSTAMFFADQGDLFGGRTASRCIRAEVGTCLAPCSGLTTASAYRSAVELALAFLEGRSEEPMDRLRSQMRSASERLQFEYASLLRDRMAELESLRERVVAFRGGVESLSFVYDVPGYDGDHRLYLIRKGRIRAQLPKPRTARQRSSVARQIERHFSAPDSGPYGLSAEEASEILLIARWFRLRSEERERTTPPEEWS